MTRSTRASPCSPSAWPSTPPGTPDNVPVYSIRYRRLKASIWRKQANNGAIYKVMVVCSYREGKSWRDTHSFNFTELMDVAKLLADAHEWISLEQAKEHLPIGKLDQCRCARL